MADKQNNGRCTADKGAQAELLAAAWLMEQGFYVFRNVAQCGPADLVAWDQDSGEVLLIDVKSCISPYTRRDGQNRSWPTAPRARRGDVHYLMVGSGRVVGFYRRSEESRGSEPYCPASRLEKWHLNAITESDR